jgi:hypothetical protein
MKKNKTYKFIKKWVKSLVEENGLTIDTMIEAYISGVIDGSLDRDHAKEVMAIITEKKSN